MRPLRPRRFGAFISPRGVYLVEYRRVTSGIELSEHRAITRDLAEIDEAAAALVALVLEAGGAGSSVAATIRGFGVSYRLLVLPPAERSVLAPVVDNEMRRLHPEVVDPVVNFALGGPVERRSQQSTGDQIPRDRRVAAQAIPPIEVLAATAPTHVIRVLTQALSRHGVTLTHLTIPPQAMARVYAEVNGEGDVSAVAMMLPGGPLIGLFQNGNLRFVTEPPSTVSELSAELQTVMDQVDRGRMYLRQQFRGADIDRVFLATDPDAQQHFNAILATSLNVDVHPLVPTEAPAAAVAALGAVLDAEDETGLSLYPSGSKRREAATRQQHRTAMYVASIVSGLALAWALFTVFSARPAVESVADARRQSARSLASLEAIRGVVEERRANAARLSAIGALAADRRRLMSQLHGIAATTPPGVQLGRIYLERLEDGWRGEITGTASGFSGAHALRAVDRFENELPRALQTSTVVLADFSQGDDETVVSFRITFETPTVGGATP
jgi:Tfp pilus assembly protein PilN